MGIPVTFWSMRSLLHKTSFQRADLTFQLLGRLTRSGNSTNQDAAEPSFQLSSSRLSLLLGFAGMLHPAEMMALIRRDLVFPKDLHGEVNALYVQVRDPKTARFARRQHCRIDDPSIIHVASVLFDKLDLSSRLYPGSISTFRKQWNALLSFLGVPFRQAERGATPGVLRGSGATFYYTMTEDLSWISWRGRWARQRTLEYYLQEVGSQLLIHQLSPVSKSTIFTLADVSSAVIWRLFTCSAGS